MRTSYVNGPPDNLGENLVPNLNEFSRRVAQRRQGGGPSAVSGAASVAAGAAEAIAGFAAEVKQFIPTKSVLQ